jgi:ribosomal protein S18 acetylase RimI-like enzyme
MCRYGRFLQPSAPAVCDTRWMRGRVVEASEEQLARASTKYKTWQGAEAFQATGNGLAFVAEEGDRIVGWCWGYHLLRPDGTTMVYVHEMEVDEDARGQGYGRQLIDSMLDVARVHGVARVFLVTQKSNIAARALYESAGGHVPGDEDSLVFWWLLDEEVVRATTGTGTDPP